MPNKTSWKKKITSSLGILEHFTRHKKIYLIILFVILFSMVYLLRAADNNPTIPGQVSHFHLAASKAITIGNFYHNPYSLLLSLNFIENNYVYLGIQLFLAVCSLLLLYGLIRRLDPVRENRLFFLLFMVLSPTFIYLFTVINHYSFVIFLLLAGFTLLQSKKKMSEISSQSKKGKKSLSTKNHPPQTGGSLVFAFLPFAIIPLFDIFSSLLLLFLPGLQSNIKKEKPVQKLVAMIISILAISSILKIVSGVSWKQIFLLGPYAQQNLLTDFFADLGGIFGASLFITILAVIGLAVSWKQKKTHSVYLLFLLLFVSYFFRTSILIYLNFFIVFFASVGFVFFINREWKLRILKDITIFVILLGVVFSTLTSLNNISELTPNPEIEKSLIYLGNHVSASRTIFSHPRDSYFVESFAQRKAFVHYHDTDFKEKMEVVDVILNSSYVKETIPLLEENTLIYLYLSSETKSSLPEEEGLLFLFRNERFKRVYQQDNILIKELGRS